MVCALKKHFHILCWLPAVAAAIIFCVVFAYGLIKVSRTQAVAGSVPALTFSAHIPTNKTALPELAAHGWQDVKVRVRREDAERVREYFLNPANRGREFRVRLED